MNIQSIGGGTHVGALHGGGGAPSDASSGIGNASRSVANQATPRGPVQSTEDRLMSRSGGASTNAASNAASSGGDSSGKANASDSKGMDFMKGLMDMLRSMFGSLVQMFSPLTSMLSGLGR
ncbi:hypothetical protein [Burkholderia pyrrocinia]|uniref:hypothetical protein n=1 Tax=Burkholderia pyrrocinia TaxID=60550 RepID=UPI0010526109|nr:hypothetical protein [Burkholderia pyrrocinia]TDA48284.1 hypothetical protein EVG18_06305 [Burkholderia pyrrocinia]